MCMFLCVLLFKQKTAYEMRISDWSSDVCSSDLLLSVLAGVESGVLKQAFNAGATVRAMPNLPAQIGKGVTVLCSEDADMDRRQIAEELMRVLGAVEWIADEALFHAVTALSGSGPGYVLQIGRAHV